MKKLIIILCALLITSALSAKVMFQIDNYGLANTFDYDYDCFSEIPHSFDYGFHPYEGLTLALGYEFFSEKVENDFHFYAGIDAGMMESFLMYGFFAGCNYKLFETNKIRYELSGTLTGGYMAAIKGPEYYYLQTTVDFVANLKSRKFPYVGIGLSNLCAPNVSYYKTFGFKNYLFDILSLHIVTGIRL